MVFTEHLLRRLPSVLTKKTTGQGEATSKPSPRQTHGRKYSAKALEAEIDCTHFRVFAPRTAARITLTNQVGVVSSCKRLLIIMTQGTDSWMCTVAGQIWCTIVECFWNPNCLACCCSFLQASSSLAVAHAQEREDFTGPRCNRWRHADQAVYFGRQGLWLGIVPDHVDHALPWRQFAP